MMTDAVLYYLEEVTGMKAYRKKWIGLALAAMLSFAPVSAFAADSSITITSGLQPDSEEAESTFDTDRIIYGEATPGTKVTFTVSKVDRFGNMVEFHRDTVSVGSLGLFSVTLPLERGNNYIAFSAEGESKTTTVIKQVPQTVKNQLQRMIALPGINTKK